MFKCRSKLNRGLFAPPDEAIHNCFTGLAGCKMNMTGLGRIYSSLKYQILMDNSFFAYLQQLEMLVFFSGYPLVYLLMNSIGSMKAVQEKTKKRLLSVLPYAYALTGTLFLGFELKNAFPDFAIGHILQRIQNPFLFCWSLLSLIFWIPLFSRIRVLSFLHSLIFFFLVISDILKQNAISFTDNSLAKNNMKIYTISLVLNLFLLMVVYFLSFLIKPNSGRAAS